jgi:F0F1-type ATP synthase assembly protein I
MVENAFVLYTKNMNERPNSDPRAAYWRALGLAWEFGYLIVVPLVVFSLGGLWLDQQFDSKPWLFLAGMALAVVFTTILLVRKFSQIIKDMNNSSKGSSETHG